MMTPASPSQTIALAQNRVLRNTYALLALSMIPTVLGAWIGVQMNFSFFAGSPAIGFIAFLAIAWASWCCSASRSSWASSCRASSAACWA
jgi:FtsH-binding integral membrane protein